MPEQTKSVHFSIQGETITNIAREKFHRQYDLTGALNLLMGCLISDQLSETEQKQLAYDILDGKARLTGTYPGDDYRLEELSPEAHDIQDTIQKLASQQAQQAEKLQQTELQLHFLLQYLDENAPYMASNAMNDYQSELDEPFMSYQKLSELNCDHIADILYPTAANSILQSFLDRMHAQTDSDLDNDYGWLEPNGTFHPVPFGEHQQWASDYIQSHYSDEEWMASGVEQPETKNYLTSFGDYLVYRKHWVLLDNPHQGVAKVTQDPSYPLTKQQKDFLFQYYSDRKQPQLAKQYLED